MRLSSRTFLQIPFDPNEVWGERDRHSVAGTVKGRTIRGALVQIEEFWGLPAGPVWMRDNRFAVGDEVEVELCPEGPQLDTIGADFAAALESNPAAKSFFEALPTFHRKNYLRWIDSAKRPETRARRIQEAAVQLEMGVRR